MAQKQRNSPLTSQVNSNQNLAPAFSFLTDEDQNKTTHEQSTPAPKPEKKSTSPVKSTPSKPAENKNEHAHRHENVYVNERDNRRITTEPIIHSDRLRIKKRLRFEEKYSRHTFWIDNDLFNNLNNFATERGDVTKIINEGLRLILSRLEKEGN